MATDFLYTTAPLVEVIAEIHWELQPLLAIPNAALDPHFAVLSREFGRITRDAGYDFTERMIPEQMPTEMFPHMPLIRYRRSAKEWPLFQLGPGILTVNIVPPYNGWDNYRYYVRQAVDWLFLSYPLPHDYLKLKKLELHYLDGFTSRLGFKKFRQFINTSFVLSIDVPEHIAQLSNAPDDTVFQLEMQLPIGTPSDSLAVLKLAPGTVGTEQAVIMELLCRTEQMAERQDSDSVLRWMDGAHGVLRRLFDVITSEPLKTAMGPKIELKEDIR